MNELNERVQHAEATEAERQAQATQQELARSQAGVKGKRKSAAVPSTTRGAGDRRVWVNVSAWPIAGEIDKMRE